MHKTSTGYITTAPYDSNPYHTKNPLITKPVIPPTEFILVPIYSTPIKLKVLRMANVFLRTKISYKENSYLFFFCTLQDDGRPLCT